jgi:hypothetical protein
MFVEAERRLLASPSGPALGGQVAIGDVAERQHRCCKLPLDLLVAWITAKRNLREILAGDLFGSLRRVLAHVADDDLRFTCRLNDISC